jgi:hypothetical protein
MSRDIKYIGMDVHKEAIVIAVLNGKCQSKHTVDRLNLQPAVRSGQLPVCP